MANNENPRWDMTNPPVGRWLLAGLALAAIGTCLAFAGTSPVRAPAAAAQAFLETSLAAPGAQKTASGLVYEIIAEGHGPHPTADDVVVVNYEGRLADGTVFDSSYQHGQPAVMRVGDGIPGWVEGLELMRPGGKARLVIPSELAYGRRGAGGVIPPNAPIEFVVELLGVESQQ